MQSQSKSQEMPNVLDFGHSGVAPFHSVCTPSRGTGEKGEMRMRWGFSSSVDRREGGTGSRSDAAGAREDRANLSRSIDAVIRALNFIRSAAQPPVQHVPNVAFFATRRLHAS